MGRQCVRAWVWRVGLCLHMCAACAQAQPSACVMDLAPALVVKRLNALRAQPQACGDVPQPAAPALRWDERLAQSAQAYARELAQRDALSHEGARAAGLRERLAAEGYLMSSSGENLAAGPLSLDEALQHWMASATHCENLMAPAFADVGLACIAAPGRYQRFWVLHLGRGPRP